MTTTPVDPVASLTGALVEANDQLLALYELVALSTDSLDEERAVAGLLARAAEVARVDGLELRTAPSHRHGLLDPKTSLTTVEVAGPNADERVTLAASRLRGSFGTSDTKLLTAIATMAVGVIRTSRLHRDGVAQAVVRSEHDTASTLAQDALPRGELEVSGLTVAARTLPASSAGGDLYTWRAGGGVVDFVVGDVSGKGLPAAVMMSNVVAAANAAFLHDDLQAERAVGVLAQIDRWLGERLSDAARFVTVVAVSVDVDRSIATIANAGHSPVVVMRADRTVEHVRPGAPPVGVLPLDELPHTRIHLSVGDRIVIGSDGFTEQSDPSGGFFGEDRFVDTVCTATGAREAVDRLFDAVDAHAAGQTQSDDRTIVVIERTDGSTC